MPLVHRHVADHPLVIDRIVVVDGERHRYTGGDVDLGRRVMGVVDADLHRARRRRRTRAGDGRAEEEEKGGSHAGRRFCSRIAMTTRAAITAARSVSAAGVGSALPGVSRPAATRDGLWPWTSTARS